MGVMPTPEQSARYAGLLPVDDWSDEAPVRADERNYDPLRTAQPSPGKRASRTLVRVLITFAVGIAATLTWQSYSDAARQTIANLSPQLGWLAPQAAAVSENVADPVASAASSSDQPQLNAVSVDIDAVRQSVDKIVTSQEQITRTVDQLVAGQEQMAREISKMQAIEQYMLYKNSEPPPKPAAPAAPTQAAPRPAPRPAQVPPAR